MNKKDALERTLKASEYAGASMTPAFAVTIILSYLYPEIGENELFLLAIYSLVSWIMHILYSLYKKHVDGR